MIQRLQAKRNEEGFTLIELLIVIIILAILAAIVVFAIGSTRKDSVASSCKTDFKSIELSAEAVNTKMGNYPANQNEVVNTGAATNGALLKGWPTNGDYTFAYTHTGPPEGFQVVVGGSNVAGGTLTNNSDSVAVANACKGT